MELRRGRSKSKKHGVSFKEAKTVFGDFLARIFDDEKHSFDEKRNSIVGHFTKNHLLIISYIASLEIRGSK
jgi:uncharacterized protein